MRPPERLGEIAATPQPPVSAELRDWGHLPDLVLTDVLDRLYPCLRSLSAFAAACRPWRRFFIASASTIVPRIPPLTLQARRNCGKSARLIGLSPAVIGDPVAVPLPAFRSTLLSASRGHLILLQRGYHGRCSNLVVVDAFTGAERLAAPLPNGFSYHYASLTPTHVLLFETYDHKFVSLRFPTTLNPDPQWTPHRLPRGASFLSTVIDFHGRVLGITDRAELLEFRLDEVNAPHHWQSHAVRLLPTTGLPDSDTATFERLRYGPRLVAAGERLLLLLIMTEPSDENRSSWRPEVQKLSVHALDMAAMRWEELDGIGEYSLFVDCAGRSAMACADAARCGVVANRVYFLVSSMHYEFGSEAPFHAFIPGSGREKFFDSWQALISDDRQWPPSQTWVYPSLFYRSRESLFVKLEHTPHVAARIDCSIL
uniref:KIB1-4 beta-propeller domain-containing protein n=1 Tax=Hordeum vulgare subsp. vulgare TaxID=112509 RepID=A0A8I7B7M5_HORVV